MGTLGLQAGLLAATNTMQRQKSSGRTPHAKRGVGYVQRGQALYTSRGPKVFITACSTEDTSDRSPVFAVVDNFDSDNVIAKSSHGEVIEAIIKSLCPGSNVRREPVPILKNGKVATAEVISKIEGLQRAIKQGQQIDGVNLSVGSSLNYGDKSELLQKQTVQNASGSKHLSATKLLKKEVNPENLVDYKAELRGQLPMLDQKLMKAIEGVTALGVPVYLAAGNDGVNYFSPTSFANGAVVVGATDAKGHKQSYSADNSLVSEWAQGTYNVEAIKDDRGKVLGFNLTGGNDVQIPSEENSFEEQLKKDLEIIDVLDIDIDKNDQFFDESGNLLDYISKKYGDSAERKNLKNMLHERLSDLNKHILGFDSSDLRIKIQKAILREQELGKELRNRVFIDKYIEKLIGLEFLKYVKFEEKAKQDKNTKFDKNTDLFFDFDNSGRHASTFIVGTSFAAPTALAEEYNKKHKILEAKKNKVKKEALHKGFPPEEVFSVIE